jgi:hypothetical protein
MDFRYRKERFETLKIKASVAKKFRSYCKEMSESQSMTLLLMIEFFERNAISPYEIIGPHVQTLEALIKKRISAVIAIMKDIEKNQTKPTTAMLQALLEQEEPKKKPLLVEKKRTTGNQPNYREHNR